MSKLRVATVWLSGCAGCHMSFLDLDEHLLDLAKAMELVYSPIADIKEFPEGVELVLVEGAVANSDNLTMARQVRQRSKAVVSFGDCAVTGSVPSLRNPLAVSDLLDTVYHEEGPGKVAKDGETDGMLPELLTRVLPLHHVINVDAFIPGCPPDPERIWVAVNALLNGESVQLSEEMRRFG